MTPMRPPSADASTPPADARPLAGRHAVVTGGGRGIGAAVADELARLGAAVTLLGRGREALEETATRIADAHGRAAHAVPCDVSDAASVDAAFAEARRLAGPPAILVANAGQSEGRAFVETDDALWERMLAVNLTGAFLCARAALPGMLEAGWGRIVAVASTAGLKGYSHTAAYAASKHGVVGLVRALAAETVRRGVTVNAVCPGYTDTAMARAAAESVAEGTGKSLDEARSAIARAVPRGTLIEPREVADAVGWLCSPGASAVTGQAVVVAAGEVMAG